MKNIYKNIVILSAMLLLTSAVVVAGSDTASITIKGYITEVVSISITETAGYDNLDLNNNIVNQEIAKINFSANAKDGFTVNLSTSNDLNLVGNGDGQQEARYTLKYQDINDNEQTIGKSGDGATITYSDGSGAIIEEVSTQTVVTNATNRSIKINYVNANLLWEPEFSDTITLSITSK